MPRKPRAPKVTAQVESAPQTESTALATFEQEAATLVPMTPQEIVRGIVEQVAEGTVIPGTELKPPHQKLRTTLAYHFGDGESVQMIDDGNRGGLGVKFDLKERPSAYVLETVNADRTYGSAVKRGMSWKGGQWRKQVSDNPVGDRLEVEGRVKDAAERILEERQQKAEQGFDRF